MLLSEQIHREVLQNKVEEESRDKRTALERIESIENEVKHYKEISIIHAERYSELITINKALEIDVQNEKERNKLIEEENAALKV